LRSSSTKLAQLVKLPRRRGVDALPAIVLVLADPDPKRLGTDTELGFTTHYLSTRDR
jgi:hypothetical protein